MRERDVFHFDAELRDELERLQADLKRERESRTQLSLDAHTLSQQLAEALATSEGVQEELAQLRRDLEQERRSRMELTRQGRELTQGLETARAELRRVRDAAIAEGLGASRAWIAPLVGGALVGLLLSVYVCAALLASRDTGSAPPLTPSGIRTPLTGKHLP